jgi:hypothetical protein
LSTTVSGNGAEAAARGLCEALGEAPATFDGPRGNQQRAVAQDVLHKTCCTRRAAQDVLQQSFATVVADAAARDSALRFTLEPHLRPPGTEVDQGWGAYGRPKPSIRGTDSCSLMMAKLNAKRI